jgi:EAL domain-containing protein (putative c-di-GMP-specific phosphodiesterase class I)
MLAQDVLRNADAAMHRAKERGRARHEIYDDALRARVVNRFSVEADLRFALARGELALYYQPQVALSSGDLRGFEALVRWHHPERGLIGPNEFVPVAEDTGLIVPLGTWVLEQACREAAGWRSALPSPAVSVNVSVRQIADPRFKDTVARILADTGLDPALLCLEVTESVLVVAAEAMTLATASLREMGVRVSIDDFGTGYASLNYLVQFRPDELKIDGVFIQGLCADPMSLAIVTAIVGLARSLGLSVVAEGIETTEQLALLRDLGCDRGQGYLFAKALPAAEARRFLVGAGARDRTLVIVPDGDV